MDGVGQLWARSPPHPCIMDRDHIATRPAHLRNAVPGQLAAPGLEPYHNVCSGLANRIWRVGMSFQRRPQPGHIGTLAEAQPGVSRAWSGAGAHANRRQHRENDLSHPVSFRLS